MLGFDCFRKLFSLPSRRITTVCCKDPSPVIKNKMRHNSRFIAKRQGKSDEVWNHPIPDWAALVAQHTPQTAYVAVDFEGVQGERSDSISGVSEMGVAIIPPPVLQKMKKRLSSSNHSDHTYATPSLEVDDMIRDNSIQSYSFRIKGRPLTRTAVRNKEKLCLSETVWVDEDEAEDRLIALLTSTQDQFNAAYRGQCGEGAAPPINMVLIGYAMTMEYGIFCSSFPRVITMSCGLFSGWCDLYELTRQSLGSSTNLINVLLALGYPYSAFAPGKRNGLHRAGNDVVRELTVLLHILHFSFSQTERTIPTTTTTTTTIPASSAQPQHPFQHPMRPPRMRRAERKAAERKALRAGQYRPSPHSDYPFTVSIRLEDRCTMAPVAQDEQALRDVFAEYDPVATAMHPDKTHAWVCLPNEEQRDRFVNDVHRKVRFGLLWRARALTVEALGGSVESPVISHLLSVASYFTPHCQGRVFL